MPPDEPTSVALAHIDGRLDTLTKTVEIRLQQTASDAAEGRRSATAAHTRLDEEGQQMRDEFRGDIRALHEAIGELQRWQSRMVGIAIGIGASSGLVSGLIVMILSRGGN